MTQTNPENNRHSFAIRLRAVLSALWHSLKRNWPSKLLSLLLALTLWALLITQDPTLTREKTFNDVAVTINGAETLLRNGLIVTSDLTEAFKDISLRVEVPQMQYASAQASNYSLRVDLGRISSSGQQEVRILSTNSSTYGTVSEIEPSTVTLDVEDYITRYRIPVTVETSGSLTDGWYTTTPTVDPSILTVSGPRSLVEQIVRAEASLDLNTLSAKEGSLTTAVAFRLLTSDGTPVESSLLEVTSESILIDSVILSQRLYPTKTIDLNKVGLYTGTPAEGYEIKNVTISPQTITAAAPQSTLDTLDALYADSAVDISGMTSSFNRRIRVRQPSELVWLNQDSLTVAVEIGPIQVSRTFDDVPIQITGVADSQDVTAALTHASVMVSGPQLWMNDFNSDNLLLLCDVSGLMNGIYTLPLQCQIDGADAVDYSVEMYPSTLQVTLTQRE